MNFLASSVETTFRNSGDPQIKVDAASHSKWWGSHPVCVTFWPLRTRRNLKDLGRRDEVLRWRLTVAAPLPAPLWVSWGQTTPSLFPDLLTASCFSQAWPTCKSHLNCLKSLSPDGILFLPPELGQWGGVTQGFYNELRGTWFCK